jgi:hypothetical protein
MGTDSNLSSTTNTTRRQAFALAIEPLERKAGARLGNPARAHGLAAFEANEEGVLELVRECLRDGTHPLRLFAHKIGNGEADLEPLAASAEHDVDCITCGQRRPLDEDLHCTDCREPTIRYTRV